MPSFPSGKDLSQRKWLLTVQWKEKCQYLQRFLQQPSHRFRKWTSSCKKYIWHEFFEGVLSALKIPSDSFKLQLTNKEEVFKILSNIGPEKDYGLDETPCRMLQDGAEILAEPISQTVNMSSGSKVSEGCKAANVKPLFTKGKNTEPKNYRPVSLLPVMCKVIERVVHNQLIEHLEEYEIIFDFQSGFRSKHSVNTCLAHLSNQILKDLKQENQQASYSLIFRKPLTSLIIKFFWRSWNILNCHQKLLDGLNVTWKTELLL